MVAQSKLGSDRPVSPFCSKVIRFCIAAPAKAPLVADHGCLDGPFLSLRLCWLPVGL